MKGPAEMCESEVKGQPNMASTNSNSNQQVDFSDYMWMGEEEIDDFDKKCEDEFWEEFLMEQAYEDMLAEEEDTQTQYFAPYHEGQQSRRGNSQRNSSERLYHSNRNCGPPARGRPPAAALSADMSALNINPGNSYQGAPNGAVHSGVPSYQILQRPGAPQNHSSQNAPAHTTTRLSLNPNAPAFVPRIPSSMVTSQAAASGQGRGDTAER